MLIWIRADFFIGSLVEWGLGDFDLTVGWPDNWPVWMVYQSIDQSNVTHLTLISFSITRLHFTLWELRSDKITCMVGFVNCFLRVSLAYLGCRVLGNKTGTSMEFSENSFQNLLYKWFCLKWNPTTQISSSFLEKISKRELANNIYRTHGKNISDYRVICKYFIYHCFTGQMWLGWSICWIFFDRFYRLTGH